MADLGPRQPPLLTTVPEAVPEILAIDWQQPWLAPLRRLGEPLAVEVSQIGLVAALNAAVTDAHRLAAGRLQFDAQTVLPRGVAYESFIHRTARVPTRDNLHDFFNGLSWLHHPVLKRQLNEVQAVQLARGRAGTGRGAARDVATLLDENGALLEAPLSLVEALRDRDWRALFETRRAAWADARLELFGHALLEKLISPRKAITAHVWIVSNSGSASLSERAAEAICANGVLSVRLAGLPVAGVPGWCDANAAPGFYQDASVFRPLKETAAREPLLSSTGACF